MLTFMSTCFAGPDVGSGSAAVDDAAAADVDAGVTGGSFVGAAVSFGVLLDCSLISLALMSAIVVS